MSPFEREYDADRLVDLLREHGGLTIAELADLMDAPYKTTRSRCLRLEREGRVERMMYGSGQTEEHEWYAAE